MKSSYSIIQRPIITEKNTQLRYDQNTFVFEVHRKANKYAVKEAVEQIFDVDVIAVRMHNVKGKVKKLGRSTGKRPDWKKAVVKIKPDQDIKIYDGV